MSSDSYDYQGQDVDGENDAGCPYIGQTGDTAVDNFDDVVASMGFSSVEEMIAAAGL